MGLYAMFYKYYRKIRWIDYLYFEFQFQMHLISILEFNKNIYLMVNN